MAKRWLKFIIFLTVFAFSPQYIVRSIKADSNCKNKNYKILDGKLGDKIMSLESHIANDGSEWKVVKESYLDPGANILVEDVIIKRDDGFTLKHIGYGRENDETFLVKTNFVEFEFRAIRWNEREEKPTDTYKVKTWWGGKEIVRMCLIYSKDIESALLHYPVLAPFFNKMPIKDVVFEIAIGRELKRFHVKDIPIDIL